MTGGIATDMTASRATPLLNTRALQNSQHGGGLQEHLKLAQDISAP